MFLNVFDELVDVTVAQILKKVEALSGEYLGGADAAAVAPSVVGGSPGEGVVDVGLGGDGLEDRAVRKGLVVLLEDFLGGGGRGSDGHGDGSEMEGQERAIGFG